MINTRYYFLIISFLTFFGLNGYSQLVKKMEPPFWWSGMKNKQLQIMVYGGNIASYDIQVDKQKHLKSIEKTENPNYVFLNIEVPENGSSVLKIDFIKEGEVIQTVDYEFKERQSDKGNQIGFNSSDVVYLLMPDRFSNGDTLNDSNDDMLEKANRAAPSGRHGGDIQGVINHLDYFNELGVTSLWINPLLENNQKKYTYHGYAITDFYRVDPRFGDNPLYKKLVSEAHQKGLKVIMDVVLNHCGINHWWINDLPSQDWIHQFPEYTQSNFRSSALIDPYASEYDKMLQQTGWFDRNMPDLNQKNKFLAKYLIQNTIWWIEYSGIDGIRLDTQPYADREMVAEWAKTIVSEYPEFTILGESWLQKIALTAYWQQSSVTPDGYSSNIPVITDFPLHYAINEAFNEEQTWTEGMAKLYYVLSQDFLYSNPMNTLVFLDNHDVNRVFSNLNKDLAKLKMAIAFQLTTRGIPSVYYGTELLLEGYAHQEHGLMRMDFPGGWHNDPQNAFTQEGRTEVQNEIVDYYKKLLHWRKGKDVIHSGRLTHFVPGDNVYVYFRYNQNECVMVVLNNNNTEKEIETSKYKEIMTGYNTGFEIIHQKRMETLNKIMIPAKSAFIIELKN